MEEQSVNLTNLDNLDNSDNQNNLSNMSNQETNKFHGEKLSVRMKNYEREFEHNILPYEAFIIRLDGRSFSKFTKKLFKPFDVNFVRAMSYTMKDLVVKFEAQTGYTHSDEITLIFAPTCTLEEYNQVNQVNQETNQETNQVNQETNQKVKSETRSISSHLFDGRVQKLITLTSAYCSVRFNHHLDLILSKNCDVNLNNSLYEASFIRVVKEHEQMFDARIMKFAPDKIHEVLNHQIWRSVYDCKRNAIQTYAHTFLGHKKIMNKNCDEMIEMLKEVGLEWENVPLYLKHGIYCKKVLVEKVIGGSVAMRAEYIFKTFKIDFSEENLNLLLEKYWNEQNNTLNLDDI